MEGSEGSSFISEIVSIESYNGLYIIVPMEL
jgi:hypothetical protein